ncbi:hypothetical protein DSO57_1004828 [Entomophthora muscae]|uniref:Uncharacterized protein n=1 Tax=Entomophthora muscae TaxID=34485 RepID=A0ACC2RMT3_9FUNG|nr:hypothetical protein DSO57_1004828 [Entomophthora muscae]
MFPPCNSAKTAQLQHYLGVLDHNSLYCHQMVADLFAQIVFHDKRLSPCATVTYQSIQPMMDKEYNKHYMAAITYNPPTPTPATTPHLPAPPNPRPPRPALPLCLPSHAILPTRHHSFPPQ